MSIYGIDVSSYQGTINWNRVQTSGVEVAVLRSIVRAGTPDTRFEANYAGTEAVGIKKGIYIFSYALSTVAAGQEADRVLRLLAGRNLELPIFYDLEWSQQRQLGSRAITDIVRTFESAVTAEGYQFGIYCNLDWYRNVLDTAALDYDYWIARFPANDNGTVRESLKPNVGEAAWQYSSKGSVPGISGNVDLNLFYKDYDGTDLSGSETGEGDASDDDEDYVLRIQRVLNSQYQAGLAEDNILGNRTLNALPLLRRGARGTLVELLQQGLIFLGISTGPANADGIFGSGTENAVREFQQQSGLAADGIVGPNTWTALINRVMQA